jgi:ribosomal protein S18 acetylase RimI-like enzyme
MNTPATINFAAATLDDVKTLLTIENSCFDIDRLSERSIRRMIQKGNCDFVVARQSGTIVAYILVLYHRGTHLARLYSLAVLPQ